MSDFDILLFTESWSSKILNVSIDGYESLNCPRPKFDRKEKRDSGGVIVYYKTYLKKYFELDTKGIIWFKIKKRLYP